MAAFTPDERRAFLSGEWTPCTSSNVREARYDAANETLYIGFDGGDRAGPVAYYGYPGVWPDLAELFARADSKGTWVWDYLRRTGWDYFHYSL